jgi:hypothetical protein
VNIAPGAAAALADVQRNFVAELDGLEVALGVVQAFSGVACAVFVGNVVALDVSDLRNAGGAG